ncbi:immunoglobulin-like domain-containing receptor 2 isoform X2 [Clinocottus analis]|uniref:immunoglobulin-like domain-containing receptor 2 isoform X2 n=1 Tax=Clinocottus analis TaxID=304258 RepID=UPI0035BFE220
MSSLPAWWLCVVCSAGVLPPRCSGVNVFVRDEKKFTVLFQSVVLPCQYSSVSTQTPVVQWVYKSYCRDRTRDAFSFHDGLSGGPGGGGLTAGARGAGAAYDAGLTAGYLDCADSSRTVRTVASMSGSSITLSEYYKSRDISITNKADLRIGEVRWGDSGVYICKVIISDDLEGQNEASVELLVLEWLFVAAVALGGVLFLLLVGVCWCQCCPHSCCCYVSCWCCPDTCCCPRHLYEAGKGLQSGASSPAYPPYFVTGVPTMIPIAPPSLVDKMSSIPPSEGSLLAAVPLRAVGVPHRVASPQQLRVLQYVEKQLADFHPARSSSQQSCSLSELSSLHEGETGFRQTYRNVQMKALPAIPDRDPQAAPQRHRAARSPEPQRHRDDLDPEPRPRQDETLPPRRHSDDPPTSSPARRPGRGPRQPDHSDEDNHKRWNPRSEHLHRKSYRTAGRTCSLDELEEFAATYKQRGGRGEGEGEEQRGEYEMELREFSRYPSHRNGPPQHHHTREDEPGDDSDREDPPRRSRRSGHAVSPLHSPQKRRGTWDGERPAPPPPRASPPSSSSQEKDYDGSFLNSLLDRKARLRDAGRGRSAARGEDDSDTPSKGSSKRSGGELGRRRSRSPSNRPEAESLSSDAERSRTDGPAPASSRCSQPPAHLPPRDKSRKVSTLLSRDSLIV